MPRVSKDMKVIIAEAAKKRVTEKNVKRLTVKDIVGDCGITRQTFYYHFKDIRALLQWIVERESENSCQMHRARTRRRKSSNVFSWRR